MTPEQAALVTTLLAATEKISSGPVWSIIFFLVVGPWVLSMLLSYNSQKRFEAVVSMYDNNIKLVQSYEKLAGQLTDVLTLNIEVQTRLVEKIEKNMFCPAIREKGKMSTERIMMMGKLAEAEQQRKRLQLKGEGLCATIRQDISPVLNSLDAMDIPRAAQMMDELEITYAELLGLRGQIERLKKELGYGQ